MGKDFSKFKQVTQKVRTRILLLSLGPQRGSLYSAKESGNIKMAVFIES
jgi:hypothetical protein